ncbi:ABC transporter permease [TM7 phylum sp. oral taxon 352]|nr:ABC transporter permease [TM7 phylum sp. oral taxon 352]
MVRKIKFTKRFWIKSISIILLVLAAFCLIAGLSENEDQSSSLSNLISFPMMFLSGTFFPLYLFPEWLRSVAQFIPITPVTDGFRLIMTEHASFMEVLPQLGIIAAWTFAVYFLAIKLFRWE